MSVLPGFVSIVWICVGVGSVCVGVGSVSICVNLMCLCRLELSVWDGSLFVCRLGLYVGSWVCVCVGRACAIIGLICLCVGSVCVNVWTWSVYVFGGSMPV